MYSATLIEAILFFLISALKLPLIVLEVLLARTWNSNHIQTLIQSLLDL
jgi:hypothetical protein